MKTIERITEEIGTERKTLENNLSIFLDVWAESTKGDDICYDMKMMSLADIYDHEYKVARGSNKLLVGYSVELKISELKLQALVRICNDLERSLLDYQSNLADLKEQLVKATEKVKRAVSKI